jgi:transcriptional regulator with XRE-family HTH domain
VGRGLERQTGLGEAVKRLRQKQGMSQVALGERAELHQTWISHIEAGRVNPTWGTSRRIAYALGVTVSDLAELAEQMESKPEVVRRVKRGLRKDARRRSGRRPGRGNKGGV